MKTKLKIIVPLMALSIAMSGCTKIITSMAGVKSSENQPIIVSESDFNKNIERIKKIDGQEVNDELGSYYHKFYKNDTIYGAFRVPKEHESTKQLIISGKGLMEPLFALNNKGVIIYDEKATKLYHATLSKHLNLLPVSNTTKLAQEIVNHLNSVAKKQFDSLTPSKTYKSNVLAIGQNILNGMDSLDKESKGDFGAYNQDFFKNVLNNYKFDFYISTSKAFVESYKNENYSKLNDAYMDSVLQYPANGFSADEQYMLSRGLSKETIMNNRYEDQIKRQTERLSRFQYFLETIKAHSKTTHIMIYPAQMLKNLTIAGRIQNVVAIDIINIKEQKNQMKSIYNPGVGDSLMSAFNKATHNYDLEQEYQAQVKAYQNSLTNASKYFNNENIALVNLRMQEADLFLKDLKNTLKFSTGIKSQKL